MKTIVKFRINTIESPHLSDIILNEVLLKVRTAFAQNTFFVDGM